MKATPVGVRSHFATQTFLKPFAVCSVLCLGMTGCREQASAFPLSLQQVRQMSPTNSMHISFEERGGKIFVSVIDKFGDSHIHNLDFGGVTKQQALEVLKRKQTELVAHP